MFNIFLENLRLIGSLYLILGACVLSNILAGIYFNVKTLGFDFDKGKLLTGIKKAFIVAIILFLLIIPITFAPYILDKASITLPDEVTSYLSVLAITGTLMSASLKYFKDAISKLMKILNISDEEKVSLIKKVVEIPEIVKDDIIEITR